MKKTLIVLAVIFGVMGLGVVACSALFVGGVNEAVEESEKKDNAPGGAKNPLAITPGKAFEVRKFNYGAGWSIVDEKYSGANVRGLKVTNNRDEEDEALVEIKVWKGSEILATIDCTTDGIPVGATVTLNCLGDTNSSAGYDKVTINDTF